MGQDKERQIQDDWQRQKRKEAERAETGAPVPPIRPFEFDQD